MDQRIARGWLTLYFLTEAVSAITPPGLGVKVNWLVRIFAWRSKQSAIVRWSVVFGLFGLALAARHAMGFLHGGIPWLIFFPVLLMVTVVFGWAEALVVLVLSVIAGVYLFLPPGMDLLPVGWVVVGGFSIGIIGALKSLAEELAEANERQRLLFQEMQHRIANTLQSVVGVLDSANRKIDRTNTEAKDILEEEMRRIMASADIHRRLNDPRLFELGLASITRDAVATVIDADSINVSIEVEEVRLSSDQMSTITMLVIEFAYNAQKHVFERGLGSNFALSLKPLPDGHAVLSVTDDGPGWSQDHAGDTERTLGQSIIWGLAHQLGGILSVKSEKGTEVNVVFPTMVENLSPANHPARQSVRPVKQYDKVTNGNEGIGG